jgi:hypothetical protein
LIIKIPPPTSISQLVSVIRTQLADRVEVNSTKQRATLNQSSSKSRTNVQGNLDSVIGQRIRSISRDDPKRGRKAFRIFLEVILLSHFGEHLINDSKFYQLIDEVQNSMEADPELHAIVDSAIEHLLSAEQ